MGKIFYSFNRIIEKTLKFFKKKKKIRNMKDLTFEQRILFGVLVFLSIAILLAVAVIIALALTGGFNSSSSANSSTPPLAMIQNGLPPHPKVIIPRSQQQNQNVQIQQTPTYPVSKKTGCKSCNG